MLAMIVPMASLGDNATGLLIAIFGGAAASLAAGYFARPKTKAEATAANAMADVTMSGDAREWANFWAQKAQEAEAKTTACEERADAAEEITARTVRNMEVLVEYTRLLEKDMTDNGRALPPVTEAVRYIISGNPAQTTGE